MPTAGHFAFCLVLAFLAVVDGEKQSISLTTTKPSNNHHFDPDSDGHGMADSEGGIVGTDSDISTDYSPERGSDGKGKLASGQPITLQTPLTTDGDDNLKPDPIIYSARWAQGGGR